MNQIPYSTIVKAHCLLSNIEKLQEEIKFLQQHAECKLCLENSAMTVTRFFAGNLIPLAVKQMEEYEQELDKLNINFKE